MKNLNINFILKFIFVLLIILNFSNCTKLTKRPENDKYTFEDFKMASEDSKHKTDELYKDAYDNFSELFTTMYRGKEHLITEDEKKTVQEAYKQWKDTIYVHKELPEKKKEISDHLEILKKITDITKRNKTRIGYLNLLRQIADSKEKVKRFKEAEEYIKKNGYPKDPLAPKKLK